MQRLTPVLLLLLLTARLCGASITAATQWEVRPANGSDLNGAGFDSTIANAGTDYSQQNSAQLSLSDMATTGVVTTITSVTGGFTAAMIGNVLRIESGTNWTVGYYQILTRVDTNTITVDRAPTSAAGVSGTGKVGGAAKTLTLQTTTKLVSGMANGNKVWVKNEAWNAAEVVNVTASAVLPKTIEGYNTARGDEPTGSNRPRNNKAGSGIAFNFGSGHHWVVKYIWGSNGGTTAGFNFGGDNNVCIGCRASSNVGPGFILGGIGNALYYSEADSNTTYGLSITNTPTYMIGNDIHGNTSGGINLAANTDQVIVGNIITANTGPGITSTANPLRGVILSNTIEGNTGATTDGLIGTQLAGTTLCFNNIFSTNGRDGVRMTTLPIGTPANYNDYSANVGTARTNFITGTHDLALAPSYTNSAGGNYAVGSALRNQGFPGTFPAGTSIGKLDMGAVQSGLGAATQRAFGCVQ